MSQILTLVNTEGLPVGLREALGDFCSGVKMGEVRDFGVALEVPFEGEEPAGLREFLAQWPVDYAVQQAADLPKRLLVSDMESTLVENEFLDDIAALAGVGDRVREITSRAMNGEIDFAGALRERLDLLTGQPESLFEQAWAGLRWMPGAQELVGTLKRCGVLVIIVSGGFKYFTSRVCQLLGADRDEANDVELVDGVFTGMAHEPILGKENKQRILEETATALGLSMSQTAAVGDGANDLPMLQAAGLGVAFHAKPSVAAAAKYQVRHSDLRALIYLMGWGGRRKESFGGSPMGGV